MDSRTYGLYLAGGVAGITAEYNYRFECWEAEMESILRWCRANLRQGYNEGTARLRGHKSPVEAVAAAAEALGLSPIYHTPAIHPNTFTVLDKAITEALAELDKLGQPHRIGCNLAGAWGAMKGQLGAPVVTPQGESHSKSGHDSAIAYLSANWDWHVDEHGTMHIKPKEVNT